MALFKRSVFIFMIVGSLVVLHILYHRTPDYTNKVPKSDIANAYSNDMQDKADSKSQTGDSKTQSTDSEIKKIRIETNSETKIDVKPVPQSAQTKVQLAQTKAQLAQTKAQLSQTKAKLSQTKTYPKKTNAQSAQINTQRSQTNNVLDETDSKTQTGDPKTQSTDSKIKKIEIETKTGKGENSMVPKDFSYFKCISEKTKRITPVSRANRDECMKLKKDGNLIVGRSWGSLNIEQQHRWTALSCDQYTRWFSCSDLNWSVDADKKMWLKRGCDPPHEKKIPLVLSSLSESSINALIKSTTEVIAVAVASTTRGMKDPSTSSMSLFTLFLPSLLLSFELGFEYRVYIGYDIGDPWWDVQDRSAYWPMMENMISKARQCGLQISFHMVRCENKVKKPGPVFNCMLRKAYYDGADYFARWNDDSEVVHPWTTKFRNFLISLGPPYGVAGPWCNQGNQYILTHDFVHRTHMEIFEGLYYPPILSDWWMDDWITLVYGRTRTKRFRDTHIKHHLGAHGTRYGVNYEHQKKLQIEIDKGRLKIAQWAKNKQLFNVEKEFLTPFKPYDVLNGRLL